jgi:hypothetical protein
MFRKEYMNWTEYRSLPNLREVDFHHSNETLPTKSYYENMDDVYEISLNAIKNAQEEGLEFVLFTHGWSTSRRGKTTTRSQVRSLMRSKAATPYIVRKDCIQHQSVFVAAIKKKS